MKKPEQSPVPDSEWISTELPENVKNYLEWQSKGAEDLEKHKGLWQRMNEESIAMKYPPSPEQLAAAMEEWRKRYTINKKI